MRTAAAVNMLEFASCLVVVHSNFALNCCFVAVTAAGCCCCCCCLWLCSCQKGWVGGNRVCGFTQTRIDKLPSGTDSTTEREGKRGGKRESKCTTILYDIQQPLPQEEKFGCVFCYCFRFKVSTLPFSFVSRTRTGLIKSVFLFY